MVLVGSNAAWAHPVLYQRISAAKAKNNTRVVVIDPRTTATCDIADLHLPLKPGSDAELFVGLLDHLNTNDALDQRYIDAHTRGFEECLDAAAGSSAEGLAERTGLSQEALSTFFEWFATTKRCVTMFSQGVNQSESGTDKCNAIINCHLATGQIGRDGMGPFSITGQPNAMGGREVGGMANQLAGHMDFIPEHLDYVREFWRSPQLAEKPGLKAVDMFAALNRGEIKAIWIMGTNPVVSLPDSKSTRQALASCPTVIVSDCIADTETTRLADILLPAAPWGEKDGTVTNSERQLSRQRKLFPLSGSARPDWLIISQVALRMGYETSFSYASVHEVFREHAALTQGASAAGRQFDISHLRDLSEASYNALKPEQWPRARRPFADGKYSTPDRRARFVPVTPRQVVQQKTAKFPFIVNTGRLRDQWHTMTRTGLSASLFQHTPLPHLEINQVDLDSLGIDESALVESWNDSGVFRALAKSSPGCPPGQVFAPIHWSEPYAFPTLVSAVSKPVTDPVSGQPESKHFPVAVKKVPVAQWWSIASDKPIDPGGFQASFFARQLRHTNHRTDVALEENLSMDEMKDLLSRQFGSSLADANTESTMEWIELVDDVSGTARLLLQVEGNPRLVASMAATHPDLVDAAVLLKNAKENSEPPSFRSLSLMGQNIDSSPIVCTCFEVSTQQIQKTTKSGPQTLDSLGKALSCGTNCGSCIPELKALISA